VATVTLLELRRTSSIVVQHDASTCMRRRVLTLISMSHCPTRSGAASDRAEKCRPGRDGNSSPAAAKRITTRSPWKTCNTVLPRSHASSGFVKKKKSCSQTTGAPSKVVHHAQSEVPRKQVTTELATPYGCSHRQVPSSFFDGVTIVMEFMNAGSLAHIPYATLANAAAGGADCRRARR
jgi:hypothetical protein